MPSPDTVNIARVLYSRCLECEFKPDKLQFTKLLYILDYCRYSLKKEKATDIKWIFYHYGPWAFEMPSIMDAVMEQYPFGWTDRSEEFEGRMPSFDPADKLSFPIETLIGKIINSFRLKDTNSIIEWCYKQTEPMRVAKRGDTLDFTTIPATGEMPTFFLPSQTWTMPKVSGAIEAKKAAFRVRLREKKAQYQQWKDEMCAPEYLAAMQMLSSKNQADMPDLSKVNIHLSPEAVDELSNLGK